MMKIMIYEMTCPTVTDRLKTSAKTYKKIIIKQNYKGRFKGDICLY